MTYLHCRLRKERSACRLLTQVVACLRRPAAVMVLALPLTSSARLLAAEKPGQMDAEAMPSVGEAAASLSGLKDLSLNAFVDAIARFQQTHDNCKACAEARQEMAQVAWIRFFDTDDKLAKAYRDDQHKLIILVSNLGPSLSEAQREELAGRFQRCVLANPDSLRSDQASEVVWLDHVLGRLSGRGARPQSLLSAWTNCVTDQTLFELSGAKISDVWHYLYSDHTPSAKTARTRLAKLAWNRWLGHFDYTSAGPTAELLQLCNTVGRDLVSSQRESILPILIDRFTGTPANLADLGSWDVLTIKWAYRGLGASDDQVADLLVAWAAQGRGWGAALNPPTLPPARSPLFAEETVQAGQVSSAASPVESLSPDQAHARNSAGFAFLVGGMQRPQDLTQLLQQRLTNELPKNATAVMLIEHAALASNQTAQAISLLNQKHAAGLDSNAEAEGHLALAYAASLANDSSVAESELIDAMRLSTDASVRFGCLEKMIVQDLASGNVKDASKLLASAEKGSTIFESRREALQALINKSSDSPHSHPIAR